MIDTVKLGRSDLVVPRICLGTMTFGEQNTETEAHEQLDLAYERGINFIDTAEMYPIPVKADTYGRTEEYIGRWLRGKPRDRIVLASKVAGPGRGMDWMRSGDRAGQPELGKRDIVSACERSLKRLGTDVIDLYQIHWPARNVPMFGAERYDPSKERPSVSVQEQLEAMDQLRRDGKIRAVGVSNETAWGVCEFVRVADKFGLPRIDTIQNVYNLMSREFDQALVETCLREEVGLLAYSPLAFGYLTGKFAGGAKPPAARITRFGSGWPRYQKPRIATTAERYAALARDHGLTPTQLALAWCYHRPVVASTIIGATSVEQLTEDLAAWDTKLDAATLAAVDALHDEVPSPAK